MISVKVVHFATLVIGVDIGLIDLGFYGNPYTWNNKRAGFANI